MTPAEQMRERAAQACELQNFQAMAKLIRALPLPTSPSDALLAELVTALEGVVRVADRKTDEFDAARSALSAARAYLGRTEKEKPRG